MAVDSLEDYSMESVDFHPLPQPPKVYPALIALFVSDGGAIEIDIHEVIKGITNEGTILSNLLADWVEYAHKKMEERI